MERDAYLGPVTGGGTAETSASQAFLPRFKSLGEHATLGS
jgi:hypothetical protein